MFLVILNFYFLKYCLEIFKCMNLRENTYYFKTLNMTKMGLQYPFPSPRMHIFSCASPLNPHWGVAP